MPIYEYKCNGCGNVFAKLVFNDSVKIECDKCGSSDVVKLVSNISSLSGASSGSSGGCGSSGFS